MSFEEQLKLMNTNDVFMMMHGAGCGNILWAKKGSILVQFDEVDNRFIMYDRLAFLLGIASYKILFSEFHSFRTFESLPL